MSVTPTTTVSIDLEARKHLSQICQAKKRAATKVLGDLIRAAAISYDPSADRTAKISVDYETRTITTVMRSGKTWTGPLTRRSWEVFRDYCWSDDMGFESEAGHD